MVLRLRLYRMSEEQHLRLTEQLPREVECRRRSLVESTGQADLGMAQAVGETTVGPEEQVQIAHRLIHLLHDTHPLAITLDVLDGGREVGCAYLVRPLALLGALLGLRELSPHGDVVERGRGFHVS